MKTRVYQAEHETIEGMIEACEKAQKQASNRFVKSIQAEIEQAAKEIKEKLQGKAAQ